MSRQGQEIETSAGIASAAAANTGCPFFGLPHPRGRSVVDVIASRYVCFAQRTADRQFADVDVGWQAAYCTTAGFQRCPFYQRSQDRRQSGWWPFRRQ